MTKLFISLYLNLAASAIYITFFTFDAGNSRFIPAVVTLALAAEVWFSAKGALLNAKSKEYNKYFNYQAQTLIFLAIVRVATLISQK